MNMPEQDAPPRGYLNTNSLKALFYKDMCLQMKRPFSLLCQIFTPVLCILFTLAVQTIAQGFTIGKVATVSFPLPFHLPLATRIFSHTVVPLSCEEIYYFDAHASIAGKARAMLDTVMKTHCNGTLMPSFRKSSSAPAAVYDAFTLANEVKLEELRRRRDVILPDGMIRFLRLTENVIEYTVGINDWRLPAYHRNNGVTLVNLLKASEKGVSYLRVTEGMLSLMEKMSRASLRVVAPGETLMGSMMYMPFDGEDRTLLNKITYVVGTGMYPLALSLVLPLLLYIAVSEKESKLLRVMQINGLRMPHYWLHLLLFALFLDAWAFAVLIATGRWFHISYFVETHLSLFVELGLGWTLSLMALLLMVHQLVSTTRAATVLGYILSVFSTVFGSVLASAVYPDPIPMPLFLKAFPPFALSRVLYLFGISCASIDGCMRTPSPEVHSCFLAMYAWGLVFAAGVFLSARHKQITGLYNQWIGGNKLLPSNEEESTALNMPRNARIDPSVQAHRLYTENTTETKPLRVMSVSKVYPNGYQAVQPLTMCLQRNEITGLLGANGAGKTTLLSMITGAIFTSSGEGWIGKAKIGSEEANSALGVCPQFDAQWVDLTPTEHLTFYMLLKGVDVGVEGVLRSVDLYEERHTAIRCLSGGMQRRLSIAIALLGDPAVVILDEPTSGLDPLHRRHVWEILLQCKQHTTILLTTHLMEEAEALCNRVGIITHGTLTCFDKLDSLKERLGDGYKLSVSGEQVPDVAAQMGVAQRDSHSMCAYVRKEQLIKCIHLLKKYSRIRWTLSEPSLSDVFTKMNVD